MLISELLAQEKKQTNGALQRVQKCIHKWLTYKRDDLSDHREKYVIFK